MEDEEKFPGWTIWIAQELAKSPEDAVLLAMKEIMEYKPEVDSSLESKC